MSSLSDEESRRESHAEEVRETRLAMEYGEYDCGQDEDFGGAVVNSEEACGYRNNN